MWMLNCAECLAKAIEIEGYDLTHASAFVRQEYVDLALGWRKVASMASFQSVALAPPATDK
jgi:hypothetical protein